MPHFCIIVEFKKSYPIGITETLSYIVELLVPKEPGLHEPPGRCSQRAIFCDRRTKTLDSPNVLESHSQTEYLARLNGRQAKCDLFRPFSFLFSLMHRDSAK